MIEQSQAPSPEEHSAIEPTRAEGSSRSLGSLDLGGSPLEFGAGLVAKLLATREWAREVQRSEETAQRRLSEAELRAAQAEESLAQIQASTSWRLTAPLRRFAFALRSAKSRPHRALDGERSTEPPPVSTVTARTVVNDEEAKQRHRQECIDVLDAFLIRNDRLVLPRATEPRVSVIIVMHNQVELTFHCLRSLAQVAPTDTEVILLDNASTDRTALLLQHIDGAQVVRAPENLHFLRGVNRAATMARGRHLLLLNNDTSVNPGAIEAAAARLDTEADLGAVGGSIVRLDGTLQEAGCIIWNDGHCEGYGRGRNPDAPEFSFRRDVDYCSGAFLMIRRQVFEDLGGLDDAFAPAYFEEADLCMRIRAAGLRVGYEPGARITHFEYGSIGSVASAKTLYDRNHLIFVERYGTTLRSVHFDRVQGALEARTRTSRRGAVLVLDGGQDTGIGKDNAVRGVLATLRMAEIFPTYCRFAAADRLGLERAALGRIGIEAFNVTTAEELSDFLEYRRNYYELFIIFAPKDGSSMKEDLRLTEKFQSFAVCLELN